MCQALLLLLHTWKRAVIQQESTHKVPSHGAHRYYQRHSLARVPGCTVATEIARALDVKLLLLSTNETGNSAPACNVHCNKLLSLS